METIKIEKIIQTNGTIILEDLPFEEGEKVEVIVIKSDAQGLSSLYPLRGTSYQYESPFDGVVSAEDWEAVAE